MTLRLDPSPPAAADPTSAGGSRRQVWGACLLCRDPVPVRWTGPLRRSARRLHGHPVHTDCHRRRRAHRGARP